MAIERFEDIAAWQGARVLVQAVHHAVAQGPFARNFSLRDQICRASVSIMSTIAGGFERGSDGDFRRFLYMVKGSAGEVRSLLYVARDLDYLDHLTYQDLTNQSARISRQIAGFIKYLDGVATVANGKAKQL